MESESLREYIIEVHRSRLLSAAEEKALARRSIRENDMGARQELINSNLRLVVALARRYSNRGLSLADLIGEGNIGLIKAVDGFDPEMNIRFSTYAAWWIKQSIRRAFEKQVRPFRVPSHMIRKIAKWREEFARLQGDLCRRPRLDEFASHLNTSLENAWSIHESISGRTALIDGADQHNTIAEMIYDEHPGPADSMLGRMDVERIRELVDRLHPREAEIIRLRYGLDGGEAWTLKDIARKLGLSSERVRQLEVEALAALHAYAEPTEAAMDA